MIKANFGTFKKVEISKEEQEIIKQQEEYCKQFLPKDTELVSIFQDEDDVKPTRFTYIQKGLENANYHAPYIKYTEYGIKKNILAEMRRNGVADLHLRKGYSFDNYTTKDKWQQEVKANAMKYVKEFNTDDYKSNKWFVISGISGSGKTHIATSVIFGLASKSVMTSYVSWVTLKNDLKNDLTGAPYIIENLKKRAVLYIDDFMKVGIDETRPSTYEMEVLLNIIAYRYDRELPTIISSERDIETEMMTINRAVAGRIIEKSRGFMNIIGNEEKRNYRIHGGW